MKTAEALIKGRTLGSIRRQADFPLPVANASGAYVEVTNFGAKLVAALFLIKTAYLKMFILGFPVLDG